MFKRATGATTTVNVEDLGRWNGAGYTTVAFGKQWNGTAWVDVWPLASGIVFALNKGTVYGQFDCLGGVESCPFVKSITSESVTASASSGSPTFLWSYVSGDSSITISNTTAATVTFTGNVGRVQTQEAVWKCAVTVGAETKELLLTVSLTYNYTRESGEIEP